MPNYHRAFIKGGTYFFTEVTYKRYPILKEESNINLLNQCFREITRDYPFNIDAIVILPNHLHTIWTLPENECDFSTRWRLIKRKFNCNYAGLKSSEISESILKNKEKAIWQRRYWEHAIRNQEDFNRHCDYIHYNPVKHGFVSMPEAWEHSSFKNFIDKGLYPVDWGTQVDRKIKDMTLE